MINWIFDKNKNSIDEFKEIYDKNFKYVYSFVLSRSCGNEQITEDIVQETFLAAWKELNYFKRKSSYSTWLCGIAKNKLYEEYRKQIKMSANVSIESDTMEEIPSDIKVEEIIIDEEQRESITKILNMMNPIYRNCLILKYIDECSVKEIAGILGKTSKAIDNILQRAKKSFILEYLMTFQKESPQSSLGAQRVAQG